jgi:hypothetical protein
MTIFKMRLRILVVLVIMLVLMAILGFAPISLEHLNDKVLHASCFGIFAFTVYWVWHLNYQRNVGLSIAAMFIMSVGSEFIQGQLPVSEMLVDILLLTAFSSQLCY